MGSILTHIPINAYTLALTTTECEGQTFYRLRVRWNSRSYAVRKIYRKTWKYKVLENALRKIQTIVDTYGKPRTLDIMGYLAQYEPPREAARRSPPESARPHAKR